VGRSTIVPPSPARTTGQQLLYALDEQVRRYETVDVEDEHGVAIHGEKMVQKLESWDYLSSVLGDDGTCIGIVAQDLKTMAIRGVPRRRRVSRDGRPPASSSGDSTNSVICTGTAAGERVPAGRRLRERRVHPKCTPRPSPGADKLRLISESARGEGGRVWVSQRSKRQARAERRSRARSRTTFSNECTRGTEISCLATSRPARFFALAFHEHRGIYNEKTGTNRERSLPRPDA